MEPKTRLAILRTMGALQTEPLRYDLESLRRIVLNLSPDLVCADITREEWENGNLSRALLEVREALVPAIKRTDSVLVPVAPTPEQFSDYEAPSGWRRSLSKTFDGWLQWGQRTANGPEVIHGLAADSLYAFVPTQRGTLVVLGHVPPDLITEALTSPEIPARVVVWQPQMHGAPTEYRLWAWSGEVQTFSINTPFSKALSDTLNASGPLPVCLANLSELLPAVLVTGFLDSVNPCASLLFCSYWLSCLRCGSLGGASCSWGWSTLG